MKKAENMQIKRTLVAIISVLMMLVIVTTLSYDSCFAAEKKKSGKPKQTVNVAPPAVDAGSFIVMSGSTSEIVYASHADRKLPIGNITKFMTAMVVIDNLHDESEYNSRIVISEKADQYGDSFSKGESVTVDDLLCAMLVGGSDEAAEALARYSASSRDIFINEMNAKAMELGLISTQFANPTGRYDSDHYSTASECAVITQAAIRYSRIKSIVAMDSVTIKIEGKDKNRGLTLTNTNPLISGTGAKERYNNCKGGICGVLDQPAEFCQYAGVATVDDMQLIVVILEGKLKSVAGNAIDLFGYGNSKATKNTIVKRDKMVGRVRVKDGAKTRVKAYTETKGFAYIPPEGSTDLVQTTVVMQDGITAPLKAGDKVGEYRIYVADELKGTVDLIVKEDVNKGWFPSKIYISNLATVLTAVIVILLIAAILRLRMINRRRARARALRRKREIERLAKEQAALDEDRRKRKWTYSKYYDARDINEAMKNRK